jgi:hypothetical protein
MKFTFLKTFAVVLLAGMAITGCRNEANEINATCFDEIQNQGEIGVDCGGPNCDECLPTCEDGISNQGETTPVFGAIGIDCGGEFCPPCSSCEDGIQNGHWVFDPNLTMDDLENDSVGINLNGQLFRYVMETGVDCGFPCPNFCEPACDDGIQNGDEQGVDCGGSCSTPCPVPSCFDGIQNGNETGIDCGSIECELLGVVCPPPTCDDGIQNTHIEVNENFPNGFIVVVEAAIDCDNNPLTSCPDCPIPTCFDGIVNQGETGIDCGGPCITACNPIANCNDGVQNGDEEGIDCGGPDCPPCPTCGDEILNGPELETDCTDYPIPSYPCNLCISCHDLVQNQDELDVDCGGPNCESCIQYLTVTTIGPGSGFQFIDQFTYNALLASGNNFDTLFVENALTIGPAGIGNTLRVIKAIQQIDTPNGIYQRTVEVFIPNPNQLPNVPPEVIEPVELVNYEIIGAAPSFRYTENFLTGPFATGPIAYQGKADLLLPSDPDSEINITYNFRSIFSGGGYIVGDITFGRMERFPPDPFNAANNFGSATNIQFAIQYPLQ